MPATAYDYLLNDGQQGLSLSFSNTTSTPLLGIIGLGFWSNAAVWRNSDTWNNGEETDTSPPVWNPPSFSVLPYAINSTSIYMACALSLDATPPIEYYFTCTVGGGNDSGWQESNEYTDTGLTPNTLYTYTCKTRDSVLPTPNEGSESIPRSAYTNL